MKDRVRGHLTADETVTGLPYRGGSMHLWLEKAVEDSLSEVVNPAMALVVRLSLDTRIALTHPVVYSLILKDLIGSRSGEVIRRIEEKLRQLDRLNSKRARSMNFVRLVAHLRRTYDFETLVRRR